LTTNRRLQVLLLCLSLVSLLLLTQDWFSISMRLDGSDSSLGSFDGVSTYPVAMPASILTSASILIGFLMMGWSRRAALTVTALTSGLSALWTSTQVASLNVAALDSQLDRLTGIAKTHGVAGLSVEASVNPWLWSGVTVLICAIAIFLVFSKGPFVRRPTQRPANSPEQQSTIDLWEQQRD
jgi:Tryptophan-associated transmembrane protein (Trp_oprn_chp)